MAESDEDIGNNLREIRTARGFTQGALADLVGVSRQTINYIEQGTYAPSTRLALQLARALDVMVADLFHLRDQLPASHSPAVRPAHTEDPINLTERT